MNMKIDFFTKIFNQLEYAESFLDGNIRFTPLKYYTTIEDERKDSREGLKLNLQSEKVKMIARIKNKNIPIKGVVGPITFSLDEVLEKKCLCLTINEYFIDFKEENYERLDYSFKGITEEEIEKFGEYIVVILKPDIFINRIKNYFIENNINFEGKNVEYKDFSKFHGEIQNMGFVKDIKYKSENEYRILADIEKEGIETINIGSLREIAQIVNYKEFKDIKIIIK